MATTDTVRSEAGKSSVSRTRVSKPVPLHISERKLLLAFMDLALLNFSLVVALIARRDFVFTYQSIGSWWFWFATLSCIWLVCALMLECYNLIEAAHWVASVRRSSCAVLATALIYSLIPYLTPTLPASRLDIILFPLLSLISIAAARFGYAKVLVQPGFHQRALVVGAGSAGRTLAAALEHMSHGTGNSYRNIGYQIVGFIDDDREKQGDQIEGAPVLGTGYQLLQVAHDVRPDELIIAITNVETISSETFTSILECRELGIPVATMATVFERLTGRVPIEHAGRVLSVAMPLGQRATHRFYLAAQRLLDVAAGLVGCAMMVAIIPFVWLANLLTSPGPLFYSQPRVGKGGQVFSILKFRSMVVDAEKHTGEVWASENDPRITPIGRILRGSRLDEIPQFWTVLRGDMSLIGPRPERPYFVNQLTQQYPFYRVRHAVKPGLTGWAQIKYRYGSSSEDSLIKLQHDLYYIKNQSLFLDIVILLKTIPVVLGFKGR